MIFTDRAAKEKISSLETRITELEADIQTKDAAIELHSSEISGKDQTIAEHVATIGTQSERITALETEAKTSAETITAHAAKITELSAKVEEAKGSATQQAVAILQTVGQPEPLAIEQDNSSEKPKMKLAEFNAMPANKRNEYIRAGGKLTD